MVIITLETFVIGSETVFNDGILVYEFGQITHVLKRSHGRYIIRPFGSVFHEGSLRRNRVIIYFIMYKSIFLQFHYKGDVFYNK